METSRPVIVKHTPERLDKKQARAFLKELSPVLQADRPQLVLNLSGVEHLDAAGVDMLIECLSVVMKHDGDIKLAALSAQAAIVLEFTRTARLFEIYETVPEAVSSFSGFMPTVNQQFYIPAGFSKHPPKLKKQPEHDGASDENIGNVAA